MADVAAQVQRVASSLGYDNLRPLQVQNNKYGTRIRCCKRGSTNSSSNSRTCVPPKYLSCSSLFPHSILDIRLSLHDRFPQCSSQISNCQGTCVYVTTLLAHDTAIFKFQPHTNCAGVPRPSFPKGLARETSTTRGKGRLMPFSGAAFSVCVHAFNDMILITLTRLHILALCDAVHLLV